jgi:hypothetical protein
MRAPACWAFPVFARMSCFYVFSRLDLCVRGWNTRKNALARALRAQKYDKIRMPGRLGGKSTTKCVSLEALLRKSTTKYLVLGGLGHRHTTKYIILVALARKSALKYVDLGVRKALDFGAFLGSPPRAAKKSLQNAFSSLQNTLSWRPARSGF